MTLYLTLLKAFLDNENYHTYHAILDLESLRENQPEFYRLFRVIEKLHESGPNNFSVDDLSVGLSTYYPGSSDNLYTPILNDLKTLVVNQTTIENYLREAKARHGAELLAKKALAYTEGFSDVTALEQAIDEFQENHHRENSERVPDFEEFDLENLYQTQVLAGGLRWRLPSLNKALGPLRKGDFGFVFARPESGKTTFLASETTYMAGQAEGPIIWFNNEEQTSKVYTRCIQAALGIETFEIFKDISKIKARFREETKGNLMFPPYEACTKNQIEALCEAHNPSLLIFDQIDKLTGFTAERNDLELGAIYQWARGLARTYCPVIGICQAGASGDGRKFLTMNDVDNSKTAKQGEADWILGIGKTYDESRAYERYFHLSKNKLLGDGQSDGNLRHGKWVVRIIPEKARYEDIE